MDAQAESPVPMADVNINANVNVEDVHPARFMVFVGSLFFAKNNN